MYFSNSFFFQYDSDLSMHCPERYTVFVEELLDLRVSVSSSFPQRVENFPIVCSQLGQNRSVDACGGHCTVQLFYLLALLFVFRRFSL